MTCPDRFSQWNQVVSRAFPHLRKSQVSGLALWSLGIALIGSEGIRQISALLATVLGEKEATLFQRLREWYLDAQDKVGNHRRDLDVAACFGPLLQWIVRLHRGDKRLALALDATTLRDQWIVLSVSVNLLGCSIPVAWKVLGSHQKGSWRPYWEALLAHLHGRVPSDWFVLVMADRGLYASWLYSSISTCGWHPFLRINLGAKVRPVEAQEFEWISHYVPSVGSSWSGEVDCFVGAKARLRCSLLLHWEAAYHDAWAIITDLDHQQARIAWYGLRSWVEGGFKDLKRGAWGWQHSKMVNAQRVERLWLAMAVALVWTISLGSQAEQVGPRPDVTRLPESHIARRKLKRAVGQAPRRQLSCLVRGRLLLLAQLFLSQPWHIGAFCSEPWPEQCSPPLKRVSPNQQRVRAHVRERKQRSKQSAKKRKRATHQAS
jgi:hypothetical protein